MRAGGEVLQAGAHRQYQVGTPRQCVGTRRTGDADGAQVEWVVPRQAAFAGLGFDYGHTMLVRERCQRVPRPAVQHTTPGHNQRACCAAQQGGGVGQVTRIRQRAADAKRGRVQELQRAVKRFGLHILRQGQADRPTVCGIGHDRNRMGQGAQDLFGPRDTVKVPRYGAKGIVDTHVAVCQVFQLLQHRVGRARRKYVARQHQQRQAVHVRQRSCRQQVARARPDGRGHG